MSHYDVLEHLRITVTDGIAVVVFAPVQEGEVQPSFFTNMRDVFPLLSMDPEVSAAVLTGEGEVFFSGTGLQRTAKLLSTGLEATAGQLLTLQQVVSSIVSFRKPVVAAVNGHAPNIGGQIALLCDAAVAAHEASFGDHHVPGGLAAGDGGTMMWPLLVGMARAREILLQGKPITAAEALEMHLVSEVTDRAQTVPAAVELAKRLAALPQLAYISTKHTINNWWRLSSLMSWDLSLAFETAGLVAPENVARMQAAARNADASH